MINQLFDIASIRQNIEDVNQEVEKIKGSLSNLTAKIKIEVPSDIQTQIQKLNETFNSVNNSLGEISSGQLRYAKAMTENAKQATEAAKQAKLYAQAQRQVAVSSKQISDVLGVQAKSMAEATEQNRILRAAAKQLDLTNEANVATLKEYNKQIEANTEFIQKNSDAYVKQKMNIGNYNSVWKGMNTSVQQLVRELPSAKYGLDIFFLAISNNIPMLMDAIKGMQAFNKQMVETGQLDKKVSIGKELLKSLISWQTLAMVGVTLLVQYGDEIIKWVGNLFKGEKALSATAKAQEALNNAWKDGMQGAQKELIEMRLLTKAIADNTLSMNDRKKAVDEMRQRYPEHLKNLSDEKILAGKIGDAYNRISVNIMQTAIAQAKMNEIAKIAEQVFEIQKGDESLRDLTNLDSVLAEYNRYAEAIKNKTTEVTDRYATNGSGMSYHVYVTEEARKRLKRLEELVLLFQQAKEIEDTITSGNIISTLTDNEDGNKDKLFAEGTVGWFEQQISLLEEEIKNSDDRGVIEVIQEKIQKYRDEIDRLLGEEAQKEKPDKYGDWLENMLVLYGAESIEEAKEREKEAIRLFYEDKRKQIRNSYENATEEERKVYEALKAAETNELNEIDEKYNQKRIAEARKQAVKFNKEVNESLKKLDLANASKEHSLDVSILQEQAIVNQKYLDGLINEEQYQKELLAIQQEYARKGLQLQIDSATELLDKIVAEREKALQGGILEDALSAKLSQENIDRLTQLIEKLKAELGLMATEQGISNKKGMSLWGMLGLDDESLAIAEESLKGAMDIMGEIDNLVNASFDARLQRIEEETEAVEKSHEKQLESLQNLYNQGAISQEEYEARKRLQEELTEKKKEELAKKEAEIKEKQAKYDKATAIAQALINTALAISSAATVVPFIPLGTIAMGIASAMGALQVATIMATPLPKYAKGTSYHKGGLAVVGDGGKQEVVMTADGAYLTPDTPTVVNLPRGAKVIPDAGLLNPNDVHWARKPFIGGLSYDDKGEPIIINDYSSLEREQRLTRQEIEKQRREMRKYERNRQLSEYKKRMV